jgi:alpha-L-rhamnosidase/acyl-CoA thioesterase-1
MPLLALLALGTASVTPLRVPAPSPVPSQIAPRLARGESLRIALYGTSLSASGPWTSQLKTELDRRYPGRAKWINVSGSGQYSDWGAANIERRVIALKPDAVFLEFGVNDAVARFHCPVWKAKRNLERMVARIREKSPRTEVVLLTTNPVIGRLPGDHSYRHDLANYFATIREVAYAQRTVLIDQEPLWARVLDRGSATYRRWVPDGIHPSETGCRQVSTPTILAALGVQRADTIAHQRTVFDLLIYGGNLAGVKAAVRARQKGKRVLIISPEPTLGEASAPLGEAPWYQPPKPGVDPQVVDGWIARYQIPVVRAQIDPREVDRRDARIVRLRTVEGRTYSARTLLDATFDEALGKKRPAPASYVSSRAYPTLLTF